MACAHPHTNSCGGFPCHLYVLLRFGMGRVAENVGAAKSGLHVSHEGLMGVSRFFYFDLPGFERLAEPEYHLLPVIEETVYESRKTSS